MRPTHVTFRVVVLLAFLVAVPAGAAGPQSVYGPSTPGDSAFARVINLLPDPVRVSLGATRIGPVNRGAVSSYYAVVPDIYTVRVGGEELEVVPQSGTWTTIACTPGGLVAFDDPPHTDPARAQLFLYNLTTAARLDLKTADGRTTVIGGVKSGASAQVVVNAVTVALAVFNGTTALKLPNALALTRGSSYSVFALADGDDISVLAVKAVVKAE